MKNNKAKFVLIILFLLHNFFIGYAQNNSYFNDTLVWHSERKLKWTDFKGTPCDSINIEKYNIKSEGISYVVLMQYFPDLTDFHKVCILPLFIKSRSWVRDTNNIILLEHEQIHFDLAELYARIIRKKYAVLTKQNATIEQYDSVFISLGNELHRINNQFDDETFFGTLIKRQKEWRELLNKKLILLNKYSTDQINCHIDF